MRRLRWLLSLLESPTCVLQGHEPVADHENGVPIARCSRCWAWKERSW